MSGLESGLELVPVRRLVAVRPRVRLELRPGDRTLVSQGAQAFIHGLHAFVRNQAVTLSSEFADSASDGIVEAAVERVKLVYTNQYVFLVRQLGECLAQIPVVVNDLIDGKPLPKQLVAMP